MGEIINLLSGQDLNSKEYNDIRKGIPYITGASNFSKNKLEINRWTEFEKNIAKKGDILITCKGTIGEMTILEIDRVHIARQLMSIDTIINNQKYILYFLTFKLKEIQQKANGLIPGINREDILLQIIPLPPLSEQRRIVEKIEGLLALVDDLETNKSDLQSYIKQAKSKVLEMAVRGELVPQNPEDEPASVLLEHIKKEQKSSKSKGKTTAHNTHYEEELPFDIPENWAWCRLGEIANIKTGKKDANYGGKEGKYPFFTCALLPIRCNIFSFDLEAILLPGNGANVGEVFYFKGKFEAYQRTYVLDFEIENIRYFYYVLKALWKKSIIGKQFGSATNYIRLSNIEELLIPLPPITEQKRIVEKIEEIFSELEFIEEALI